MNINHNKQHHHFAMHPWFAMGHVKPYMQLSNNLAEQGHSVTFFLPSEVHPSISPFNSHPDLITLIPITLPPVSGLDPNIQTTADCDLPAQHLLAAAFDKTAPVIQSHLQTLRPDAIFFDFAHWIPDMAKTLGILSICFYSSPAASLAYLLVKLAGSDRPRPSDFPPACLALSKHENNCVDSFLMGKYGEGITLGVRLKMSGTQCDMIAFRTFRELEGYYLDYIQQVVQKPVFPVGHTLLPPPATPLVEKMQIWLGRFEPKSVVYCSFGSECPLPLDQLQELLLGLELTGFPFLVALRPPEEADSIESALPDGFKKRTQERGLVTGEWVQQQHILGHESVGCFITHCGASSAAEVLMSDCQLVLLPYLIMDGFVSAKVMSQDMRVGVEVERGYEDGLYDRNGVCKAVMQVMNFEDGVGKEVKINHDKLRRVLLSPELESSWYQEFETKLKHRLSMVQ